MRLDGRTIAVVGGDEREREIARLAASTGAEVRAYGFPWPEGGIEGVTEAPDAESALAGAHYALFPIPGLGLDGSLYAPAAPAPIVPDERLLGLLAPGAHVILGTADERLRAAAERSGVTLHEYEGDEELMLLRGPAIVEGALAVAIENTEVTIHSAEVAVVGHGTIGSLLARTLVVLGARVHVFARNPVQRAAAYAAGASPHPLEGLAELAPSLRIVFSTVPAPVVGRPVIERLPRDALLVDLAAPPGGIDLEAARELGNPAVWARGLGKRAPVTVGASQWLGIRRRIEAIEEER
ncbi:MAG TPA: dipicolinate synthase subunit DpsA [Gaiellaceae bacterium]|nr:dipicolinate synthase subunit DpsA [Gaiellaceae bacterium]